MGFFRSLAGILRIELISADLPALLRFINEMEIPICNLRITDDLTAHFNIARTNFHQIQNLVDGKGGSVAVVSHIGVFWKLQQFEKRSVLIAGIVLVLVFALYLPTRILFVEVEGNETIPEHLILEAAQDAGISFGASRSAVRSEGVKNKLLGTVPQLQWACVNTYGCRAVITVRERMIEQQGLDPYVCSSIVATCDGVVDQITVTNGTGFCSVGQVVRKGQVLISGYMDCGGVIIAGRASGEVFAQTRRELTVITPSEGKCRVRSDHVKIKYSLTIGKKRINFYKGSGISDGSCVKMVSQYHLTLPGGYQLPIVLIKEQCTDYETQTIQIDDVLTKDRLAQFGRALVRSEAVACTILNAKESSIMENGVIKLSGIYSCNEMIGREQREQIGDLHGKTD